MTTAITQQQHRDVYHVYPGAILQVLDHYSRTTGRGGGKSGAERMTVGTVMGYRTTTTTTTTADDHDHDDEEGEEVDGGSVTTTTHHHHITHCYPELVSSSGEVVRIDVEHHRSMYDMHRKVHPGSGASILGWYNTTTTSGRSTTTGSGSSTGMMSDLESTLYGFYRDRINITETANNGNINAADGGGDSDGDDDRDDDGGEQHAAGLDVVDGGDQQQHGPSLPLMLMVDIGALLLTGSSSSGNNNNNAAAAAPVLSVYRGSSGSSVMNMNMMMVDRVDDHRVVRESRGVGIGGGDVGVSGGNKKNVAAAAAASSVATRRQLLSSVYTMVTNILEAQSGDEVVRECVHDAVENVVNNLQLLQQQQEEQEGDEEGQVAVDGGRSTMLGVDSVVQDMLVSMYVTGSISSQQEGGVKGVVNLSERLVAGLL